MNAQQIIATLYSFLNDATISLNNGTSPAAVKRLNEFANAHLHASQMAPQELVALLEDVAPKNWVPTLNAQPAA